MDDYVLLYVYRDGGSGVGGGGEVRMGVTQRLASSCLTSMKLTVKDLARLPLRRRCT